MSDKESNSDIQVESHPWESFIPEGTKVALMGTFPPTPDKWAMRFFYPNRNNDFWRIFGLIFFDNPEALYDPVAKSFRVYDLKALLSERKIAIAATALKVRRLRGNASDKHLEIVEKVNLPELLTEMPSCRAIGTTGEKAAEVIAEQTDTSIPKIGASVELPSGLSIWRLPSTSRAYPLAMAKKAEYYRAFFAANGIL